MSFNIGIGDVLAVTKMAWNLYHSCYVVARDAPDDFRQLVNELASLQGVLRTLRDDVNSDKDYLEKLGEQKKAALERCIAGCYESLKKVEELVLKYREIGLSDGIQFWRRIKWTTHQGDMQNLRAKIMVHTCNLNLVMSSMGNSSLARIERSVMIALEQQKTAAEDVETPTSRQTVPTPSRRARLPDAFDGPPNAPFHRIDTNTTLVDRLAPNSPELTPSISEDDPDPSSALPMLRQKSGTSTGKSRRSGSYSTSDGRRFPPSPRASEEGYTEMKKTKSSSGNTNVEDTPAKPKGPPNVADAIAEAMKELSKLRKQEQSVRPLRYPRRDEIHQPDETLKTSFLELINEEAKYRRPNARDWLRTATWWLLKARNKMELHEAIVAPASPTGSVTPSQAVNSPFCQAYVDLLKVSWILYDVFLPDENLVSLLTEENRKLFFDCSHGLNEDLTRLKAIDIPEKKDLYRQNLNIWEEQQSEEVSEDDDLLPGLDHGRWLAVDHAGAGEEHEQVLFRTFVDAAIGSRSRAVRSRGWPYMLILSSQEGDSEPKVTLCNQSGSLGVTRDFTPDDIAKSDLRLEAESGMMKRSIGTELISMDFGELKVKLSFSNNQDLSRFMSIPRNYFQAINEREPHQYANATESLIYRSSVEAFEILTANTMKPTNPKESHTSCDLRILETTGKEGWRIIRRIVLSSSVGEKRPWCKSYFLPLSNVRINREGLSRQVKAKWSNCTHLLTRPDGSPMTDGNWHPMYTYVYDETDPNTAMELNFRTQADATDFEQAVIKLSFNPIFQWSTGPNMNYVYDIQDTEPNPKEYKGILLQHTRLNWKYSEFFFMFRDGDYQYNRERLSTWLPNLYYTNYVSSHVEKLYPPEPSKPVKFSHCEKKIGNCPIEFENELISQGFMSALTPGHQLLFSRRISFLNNKKPAARFWNQGGWQSKGPAELQIWRKGSGFRLLSRWADKADKDRWVTMSLPRTGIDMLQRGSNLAVLPSREYERGRKIDMANLIARDPRDPHRDKLQDPFTISFETFKDREEFAELVNGPRRDTLTEVFGMVR